MTRRLAGRPSLSPRRRSSRGRQSSPPSRSWGPHHRMTSSSSRSPSPKRHRTASTSPRRHDSRSSSPERGSHPYDSDIRLLRLRADNDDQHPASIHPRDSPDPGQSTSVDASQLSTEKVQKLLLISLLLQLSRTMRIPYLIVLQTNNWYPMSGTLLPLLQLSITANHWRLMDC